MSCPFTPNVFAERVELTDPHTSDELEPSLNGKTPLYVDGFSWRAYTEDLHTLANYEYPWAEADVPNGPTYCGNVNKVTIGPDGDSAVLYAYPPDDSVDTSSEAILAGIHE